MALLKNEDTGADISRFISCEIKQEVIRAVWQTLDGATYMQRYGRPTVSYEITAYVNEAGKQLLFAAEDTAALLKIVCKHGTFYGRISEMGGFERLAGDYYKAKLTIAPEVEDE